MIHERVVFDCNVFLQAILSDRGPAYGCWQVVRSGGASLIVSPQILAEIRRLPDHRELRRLTQLTVERVDAYLTDVLKVARFVADVPCVFEYPRDPDVQSP